MFTIIKDRKIRVGVVGCGRISGNHFKALEVHKENVELVAVCDNDLNVVEQHSKKYQVPGYWLMEDMLSQHQLDLVVLCTPSGLHSNQAMLA
ncbi:oxidoreductase, partial [Achromatium sp. WMS2]